MCGIAGCYQRHDGAARRPRDGRPARRTAAPTRTAAYDYRRRRQRALLARAPPAVDHRPERRAADQPFTKDGLTLVYNGELYNYRELRAELVAAGVRFRTASDTEVVLEAWRRWGPAVPRALPRHVRVRALRRADRRPRARPRPARHQAALYYLRRPRRVGRVRVGAEGDRRAPSAPSSRSIPRRSSRRSSTTGFPTSAARSRDVQKLPPGTWAEFRPDGIDRRAARTGRSPRWPPRRPPDPPPISRPVDRGLGRRAPRRRRARVDVPLRRPRLEHHHACSPSGTTRASTRTRSRSGAEDQLREAMPDDALYARKVAAQLRHRACTRSRSRPTSRTCCRAMVDILDEPIGDPAAINTLLICESGARRRREGAALGDGRRRALRRLPQAPRLRHGARYQRLPRGVRNGVVRPTVDRVPVAVGERGLRPVRWAKRFLTFAELPEEAAFRRSYTLYDADEPRGAARSRARAATSPTSCDEHRGDLRRHDAARSRQPHVPRRRAAVPARAQPRVHRPREHGGVDRGPRAVRRRRGRARRVLAAGLGKVAGRRGKVALKRAAEAWLPQGDRVPAEGIVRRAAARVDLARPP